MGWSCRVPLFPDTVPPPTDGLFLKGNAVQYIGGESSRQGFRLEALQLHKRHQFSSAFCHPCIHTLTVMTLLSPSSLRPRRGALIVLFSLILALLTANVGRSAAQATEPSPVAPSPAAPSPAPPSPAPPTPAPPSPAPSVAASPAASQSPQPSRSPVATPSSSPRRPSPSAAVGAVVKSGSGGLSDGAKIGLGVGLAVGVCRGPLTLMMCRVIILSCACTIPDYLPSLTWSGRSINICCVKQVPALIALAVAATVAGVVLYRRAHRANPQPSSSSAATSALTSGGAVQRSPSKTSSGAVLYRSRMVATTTNPASADTLAAADLAADHDGTASGDLQKSVSTLSFSSVSSGGSWRRNNNVDLFIDEEPV